MQPGARCGALLRIPSAMKIILRLAAAIALSAALSACGKNEPSEADLRARYEVAINQAVPFVKKQTNWKLTSFQKKECKEVAEGAFACGVIVSIENKPPKRDVMTMKRNTDGKFIPREMSFADMAAFAEFMKGG